MPEILSHAQSATTIQAKVPGLKRLPLLVGCLGGGLLFFSMTSPKAIPSVLLVVGFFVVALMLYASFRLVLLLTGMSRYLSSTSQAGLLITVSVLPMLLLMLQSIGQLSIRDILTLGCLFLIGMFYVSRVIRPAAKIK